jgi:hypothetical protein
MIMAVIDLGRLKKLPKDHPFSGGRISFARKPPKGWPKSSESSESSSPDPERLKRMLDLAVNDWPGLVDEMQKQIEQEAREQMSGSPTTDEPKDSKS